MTQCLAEIQTYHLIKNEWIMLDFELRNVKEVEHQLFFIKQG